MGQKEDIFAKRLKEALEIRRMSQAELSRRTKIPAGDISHYLHAHYEAKQNRVMDIADALDVSEAWLMGLDVPMERQTYVPEEQPPDAPPKTIEAKILAAGIDRMPESDRKRALEIVEMIFHQYQDYFERDEKEDDGVC